MDSNSGLRESAHQIARCRENDSGQDVSGSLVVSGGDAPELLDSTEEPLDQIALRADLVVECPWLRALALGRDDGDRSDFLMVIQDGVGAAGPCPR